MANEPLTQTGDPDVDLWLDDGFANLDTRKGAGDGQSFGDTLVRDFATPEEVAKIEAVDAAQLRPDVLTNVQLPAQLPPPGVVPGRPENEQQFEPEVFEYPDGSSARVEVMKGGTLKATLSLGGGAGPEVFYGKDKNELFNQLIVAKLNASKKIREQNKILKTKPATRAAAVPKAAPKPVSRELTVDEKFAIKTQLENDPDLAMQEWFQKKTGMTLETLVTLAKEGGTAKDEAMIRDEVAAFKEEHPRYISVDSNFTLLMGWLTKEKLNREYNNSDDIWEALLTNSLFTRETLAEAYDALTQDGLLELVPEETAPPEPEPTPVPTPTPAPGIPAATRPRAASIAFGVRPSSATVAPTASTVPTAEELDKLSTTDINALMAQVRQSRAATRRR